MFIRTILLALTALVTTVPIRAAETVKIGFITTLTTPAGVIGKDKGQGSGQPEAEPEQRGNDEAVTGVEVLPDVAHRQPADGPHQVWQRR
mgnify:CR=1 FL=1